MGRRSRKRAGDEPRAAEPAPPPPSSAPSRRARIDEAPKAPWHPIPLVELMILGGLVLTVVGVATGPAERPELIIGGIVMIALASCELSIREHFAGYRSHSALLALVVAFAAGAVLWWATEQRVVVILGAAAVFAPAFFALRAEFARRAGGLTWRA